MRAHAFAIAAALTLVAAPASALEKEHHFGLDAGLSILKVADKSTASTGVGFGLHYTYGFDDAFNIEVEVMHSIVALDETGDDKTPATRPETVTHGGAGVLYVLDTISWVPYGGLLVGGASMRGGTLRAAKLLPDLVLALGLDRRLLNGKLAIGFALRQHMFLENDYPTFTQALARVEYTF